MADVRFGDWHPETCQSAIGHMSVDERHYWIGTLYILMLPNKVRRSQATYFTLTGVPLVVQRWS